jgi:hypothetical protein
MNPQAGRSSFPETRSIDLPNACSYPSHLAYFQVEKLSNGSPFNSPRLRRAEVLDSDEVELVEAVLADSRVSWLEAGS